MRKTIISLLGIFLYFSGFGQGRDLITSNFSQSSIDQVAREIESQTDYRFFYDLVSLDSTTFTLSVTKVHLTPLLTKLFENTDYKFAIDQNKNVFITRGRSLSLQIAPDFFSGGTPAENQNQIVRSSTPTLKEGVVAPSVEQTAVENKLFEIGSRGGALKSGRVNISGYVRGAENGEELFGVSVGIDNSKVRVMTDQFGYYSLLLPAGRHTLHFSFMGMFDTRRLIDLRSDGKLDVDMKQKVIQLKEVVVSPEKMRNVQSTSMGMDRLNIASIKQIPSAMGEVDVLRAVLSLPGVKSVGESSTGMNVRGGATDQNLILFNDLNIYNPSHLFGFFSAIDADVVKDVNLYKSSIPAKYGGRISSVLDMTSLDGNSKKLSGSAGIGPLMSKLSLNGPIAKDKTTFVIGARSTYSDWIFNLLPKDFKDTRASFYDGTIHLSHKINKKNQIYLNGYMSKDKLNLDTDTRYVFKNMNGNVRWKTNFNSSFYMVMLAGVDHFGYQANERPDPMSGYELKYQINQYKTSFDFSYFLSNNHTLLFGISSKLYKIQPGQLAPWGNSLRAPDTLQNEQGLESAAYFSDQITVTDKLSVEAGARMNVFNFLGPQKVNVYAKGVPLSIENLTGTVDFGSGKIIKTYMRPDIRLSARYLLDEVTSVKASFNTLHQFIHQLSNTVAEMPTDIWKLSDKYILPQKGQQVSLGLYRNFENNTIETSIEVYYKWINNYLDYKSGAILIMNHHLETDVFRTKGKAYGVEFMVKKSTGKLNGWLFYNYSKSLIREDDPLAGEIVNQGNYYPSNFDQPQNASIIGNYKISHRFSISANATYSSGRPVTMPIGVYDYEGASRVLYSDRNSYRVPDYFRLDLSMNIEGNHKVHQFSHNSWTIGAYNLTGRRNAYSVYFVTQDGKVNGYKLSIFGAIIPYITFNIHF